MAYCETAHKLTNAEHNKLWDLKLKGISPLHLAKFESRVLQPCKYEWYLILYLWSTKLKY